MSTRHRAKRFVRLINKRIERRSRRRMGGKSRRARKAYQRRQY